MTDEKIIDAFAALQPLILNRATSFNKTTGIPFDELVAEARLALAIACATHKRRRGVRIEGYARRVITNRLIKFSKRWRDFVSLHDDDYDLTPTPPPVAQGALETILSTLSNDARFAVELILERPARFRRWGARSRLRRELMDIGWKKREVERIIWELKQVFGWGKHPKDIENVPVYS